jgi:hypothetical protein
VQLGDDVRYCVTYTGDFREPPFGNEVLQRLGEREEILGRASVGLGTIWIAAAQRRALAEFPQQESDFRGRKGWHLRKSVFTPTTLDTNFSALDSG